MKLPVAFFAPPTAYFRPFVIFPMPADRRLTILRLLFAQFDALWMGVFCSSLNMKIAFVGKGGSGKTTISALFIRYVASRGLPVIAIDADINQQLPEALGVAEEQARSLKPMGAEIDLIKEYVRGCNTRIASRDVMIKTTPPGAGSRLITVTEHNPVYDYFALSFNGIRVMAAGPYTEDDLGIKCYHSKTGAVELFLNHLIDGEREYVVTDMTAGADSFASGLFTRFDATFIVVEPTLRSLGVYQQYKHHSSDYGVTLGECPGKVRIHLRRRQTDFQMNITGRRNFMSLTVTADLKQMGRDGALTSDEFINCIRHSLPRAWQVIDGLAAELRGRRSLTHAIHAPRNMDDEQRGQLLRLMASSSMRAAVERHYGLRFEFQNCHNTAAFRRNAVGSPEHHRFVSAEAQILAQSPELVDC